MNICILFIHILLVGSLTLFALRLGKAAMTAFLALLAILCNLFLLKEISFFGFNVTTTDSLAVGYLLGLNLIQEFYGRKEAQKMVWTCFFVDFSCLLFSLIHLLYLPTTADKSQSYYLFLLTPLPRIFFASMITFFFTQFLDLTLFNFFRKKFEKKYFPLRAFISDGISEAFDTLIFTVLAFFGSTFSLLDLFSVSFAIKMITLLCLTFFLPFAKRFVPAHV